MMVRTLDLSDSDAVARWDRFVSRWGMFYHASAWGALLKRTYGFAPHYLHIEEGGEIVSAFPLARVRMSLLRDSLVSVPHVEAGGMVNPAYQQHFFQHIFKEIGAAKIRVYQFGRPIVTFRAATDEVILIKDLPESVEAIIPSLKGQTARQDMRKALSSGFEVSAGNDPAFLESFYGLYLTRMREFGTPPHSFRFMRDMADALGEDLTVILVRSGKRHLGAGLYVGFNDTLYNPYLVVPAAQLKQKVGYLIGYEAHKLGIERGLRRLVLGRSAKCSGTHHFKVQMGGVPHPIYLYDFVKTAGGYETQQKKTIKERYSSIAGVWNRLPSFVTDAVGPVLRKWVC